LVFFILPWTWRSAEPFILRRKFFSSKAVVKTTLCGSGQARSTRKHMFRYKFYILVILLTRWKFVLS
jgi:hypothetical protein